MPLVTDHLRWQVGSGQSIAISSRFWVAPMHAYDPSIKVASLINQQNGTWDLSRLTTFYDLNQVHNIIKLPISRMGLDDSLIWTLAPNGSYSCKEGYKRYVLLSGAITVPVGEMLTLLGMIFGNRRLLLDFNCSPGSLFIMRFLYVIPYTNITLWFITFVYYVIMTLSLETISFNGVHLRKPSGLASNPPLSSQIDDSLILIVGCGFGYINGSITLMNMLLSRPIFRLCCLIFGNIATMFFWTGSRPNPRKVIALIESQVCSIINVVCDTFFGTIQSKLPPSYQPSDVSFRDILDTNCDWLAINVISRHSQEWLVAISGSGRLQRCLFYALHDTSHPHVQNKRKQKISVDFLLEFLRNCLYAWNEATNAHLFLFPQSLFLVCKSKTLPWKLRPVLFDVKEAIMKQKLSLHNQRVS